MTATTGTPPVSALEELLRRPDCFRMTATEMDRQLGAVLGCVERGEAIIAVEDGITGRIRALIIAPPPGPPPWHTGNGDG